MYNSLCLSGMFKYHRLNSTLSGQEREREIDGEEFVKHSTIHSNSNAARTVVHNSKNTQLETSVCTSITTPVQI